jgi:nucleotide-binding universal stress UspA family protein
VDAKGLMVRSESTRGDPVGKIVQEVNRMKPDLIILGSHAPAACSR